MPRNTPKLFLLRPGSRKCFWRSKEDRLRLRCGSHRTAVELPLRMDGWKRNRDWAHGISLEIVPYDLYPFLLSDNACKTRHANNNFICLQSAWNYGRERQQTVPVTMSHMPSASAACLKLYLLLLHLPACGGTWGVAKSPEALTAVPNSDARQLRWHQLFGASRQPEHGPQHLRCQPACCFCSLCSRGACAAFRVQVRAGSTSILVGNKQAQARLKPCSITLSVTLYKSLNSRCDKADGEKKFDFGKKGIRRKWRKHGILPLKQPAADLICYHLLKIVLGIVTHLRIFFQSFHLSPAPAPFLCSKRCFLAGC